MTVPFQETPPRTPLRVLILEDSHEVATTLVETLRQGGYDPLFQRVDTAEDFSAELNLHPWDIIFSDHSIGHFNSIAALQMVRDRGLRMPFIVISGVVDEDVPRSILRAGASDFIPKGETKRLVSVVARELGAVKEREERRRMQEALRQSEAPDIGIRWKRVLDLLLLASLAPAMLVFFPCISVYIKLVSRGPVFFKRERIGFRGKSFMLFKFRSMYYNAATDAHRQPLEDLIKSNKPLRKLDSKGDKRLIPLGWILRATGLDELPQLINVLKGEMSIVGPRPTTHDEFVTFQPWHKERLNALPGLTGLWQVSGKNDTTLEEMIKLDISYARRQSISLDLKILFMTFLALVEQVKNPLKRPSPTPSRR